MNLNLPSNFIIFDTEFTAWKGSREREWSGPNEYRELVQIGALKVNENLEVVEEKTYLLKPQRNPTLSNYFKDLTGISQEDIDSKGEHPNQVLNSFAKWVNGLPMYAYGKDGEVIIENCELLNIECPFKENQFHDVRDIFIRHGVSARDYESGTIVRAFGKEPSRSAHDALNDARSIVEGLNLLQKKPSS